MNYSGKTSESYDILSDVVNDDIYGAKTIMELQKYDKASDVGVINRAAGRPDLQYDVDANDYGYLLFANPGNTWQIGETFNYYSPQILFYIKSKDKMKFYS